MKKIYNNIKLKIANIKYNIKYIIKIIKIKRSIKK